MRFTLRIRPNPDNPRKSEVCLATPAATLIVSSTARFVVCDPITNGCLDLIQIGLRKMIKFFGHIVVCRTNLGLKDSLQIACPTRKNAADNSMLCVAGAQFSLTFRNKQQA